MSSRTLGKDKKAGEIGFVVILMVRPYGISRLFIHFWRETANTSKLECHLPVETLKRGHYSLFNAPNAESNKLTVAAPSTDN